LIDLMLEIVSLVDRLAPGLVQREDASVACVCTTRPKYLVFNRRSKQPACVVEFGPAERLVRVDGILSELHPRFPSGVARPICCTSWHNGTYVQIQEGLGGMPWFRLSDALASANDWRAMLDRAVKAMLRLHAATREVPAWTGSVLAGAELRRQASLCNRDARLLSEPVLDRIRGWSRKLDAAGPMRSCWQHGDFSLNNLLVSEMTVSVIDFDEFGGTLVPLHDAFGLALSVRLSQSDSCPLSFAECIAQCVEPARQDERVAASHLPALLMHHLLCRINQCHGLERRAPLKRILLGWVVDLAEAPAALGLGSRG
jgi:Phosphotransferase enzyme family